MKAQRAEDVKIKDAFYFPESGTQYRTFSDEELEYIFLTAYRLENATDIREN